MKRRDSLKQLSAIIPVLAVGPLNHSGSPWINRKERLPQPGKYVIAKYWPYYGDGTLNWGDSTDQENANTVIVKRVMLNPANAKNENNLEDYEWDTFGSSSYFGQEITHWMPIPIQ